MNRTITCKRCNRVRRTQHPDDICKHCLLSLPRVVCDVCNKPRFQVNSDSTICRGCTGKYTHEKVTCVECGASDFAHQSDPDHCRKCYRRLRIADWRKSLHRKINCGVCGQEATRTLTQGEAICNRCYTNRRLDAAFCIVPGCKIKQKVKSTHLCARHHDNQRAVGCLRRYLESWESPYPANNRYMSILASTIDWNQVGEGKVEIKARHLARFRAIGGFFQTYELPKVMTWETIKAALPKLGGTNPEKIQFIRTSLFQLGELLAESGEMEQWSRYLFRGQRDRLLARCPPCFRDHITGFFTWRANSMLNANIERSQLPVELVSHAPRILIETTASVIRFLAFCADRKAAALTDIGPDLVHAYEDFA